MWVDCVTQLGITPADPLYTILISTTALSKQLRAKCNVLTVQLLKQELAAASIEEQQLLHALEKNSFIREVYLVGDNIPLVAARVVAPQRTYLQFKPALDKLGAQLLGEAFLYTQTYTRSGFQYCLMNNQPTRRSIFDLESYKILIQETFLNHAPY